MLHPLRLVPNTRGRVDGGGGGQAAGGRNGRQTHKGGKADPKGRYKCASQRQDTSPTATRLDLVWTKLKGREND